MSTEPQTMACWKGEDCEKCKGREACRPEFAIGTNEPYRTVFGEPPAKLAKLAPSVLMFCGDCKCRIDGPGWCRGCGEDGKPCSHNYAFEGGMSTLPERPRPVDKDVERTDTLISSLLAFQQEMDTALVAKAEDKGYSAGGDSGGRPMLDAVALIAGEGTHPIGEILYKVARWKAKRNPEDLVKVAAWAFLLWDQQKREGER